MRTAATPSTIITSIIGTGSAGSGNSGHDRNDDHDNYDNHNHRGSHESIMSIIIPNAISSMTMNTMPMTKNPMMKMSNYSTRRSLAEAGVLEPMAWEAGVSPCTVQPRVLSAPLAASARIAALMCSGRSVQERARSAGRADWGADA